jgi:UDPglucose--hexose-1-phosphate uridylyltransferase
MQTPHRRWNPLRREWVLVSPQRTQRPWQGQTETVAQATTLEYDPSCYLCPGNARANGEHTPKYTSTYVFENDFAALKPEGEAGTLDAEGAGLLKASTERGVCRVLCFDPRHDLTLATMDRAQVRRVVETWAQQAAELGAHEDIRYVQIFENRGAMMGASNPHPHGQIWANATLPNEPAKEQAAFAAYQRQHTACLLCEYLKLEKEKKERVVCENDEFAAVVPFWAVWPFETMVISRRHAGSLEQFSESGRDALADILHRMTARYDNLFQTSFPYSMGFHQRPTDGETHAEWHFHAHFYPPLLRSAVVRKFMVGYELLGTPQRDITPEEAAGRLREAGEKQ